MYRYKNKLTNLLVLLMLSGATLMLSCSKDVKSKNDKDQKEYQAGDPQEIFTRGPHSDKLNYLISFIENFRKGSETTYAERNRKQVELISGFINAPDSKMDIAGIEKQDSKPELALVRHLDEI